MVSNGWETMIVKEQGRFGSRKVRVARMVKSDGWVMGWWVGNMTRGKAPAEPVTSPEYLAHFHAEALKEDAARSAGMGRACAVCGEVGNAECYRPIDRTAPTHHGMIRNA